MNFNNDNFIYKLIISIFILTILFYTTKIFLFFAPAIIISLFVIYITKPIYIPLEKITKNKTISILITITLLITAITFIGIKTYSIGVEETTKIINNPDIKNIIETNLNINITKILSQDTKNLFSIETIKPIINELIQEIKNPSEEQNYNKQINKYFGLIFNIIIGTGYAIIQIITAFLMTYYIVKYRINLTKFILQITPEDYKKTTKNFIKELSLSLNSIFMGLFLTGLITGGAQYIIFKIFDIPYPFMLSVITGILTILPVVGSWLVFSPITINMILSGNIETGIIFLILNIIIVGILPDIITKPLIISNTGNFNILLVIISFIGGAGIFGTIGLFIGPIIIAIALSLLYSFNSETKEIIKPIYGTKIQNNKKEKDIKPNKQIKVKSLINHN
jgi:predicted PurR-regulated permease PerM